MNLRCDIADRHTSRVIVLEIAGDAIRDLLGGGVMRERGILSRNGTVDNAPTGIEQELHDQSLNCLGIPGSVTLDLVLKEIKRRGNGRYPIGDPSSAPSVGGQEGIRPRFGGCPILRWEEREGPKVNAERLVVRGDDLMGLSGFGYKEIASFDVILLALNLESPPAGKGEAYLVEGVCVEVVAPVLGTNVSPVNDVAGVGTDPERNRPVVEIGDAAGRKIGRHSAPGA